MLKNIVGHSDRAPTRDYSIEGSSTHRMFGVFNAFAVIATSLGNGIIPEIQVRIHIFRKLNLFLYDSASLFFVQ